MGATEPCTLIVFNGLPDYCEAHRRYHHGARHRAWALGTDAASIAKREQWTKLAENIPIVPETKQPTVPYTAAQMVAEYTATLAEHLAGGSRRVPLDVWMARREICNTCGYRDTKKDACKICRCKLSPSELEAALVGEKLKWAVARCPIDRWGRWYADGGGEVAATDDVGGAPLSVPPPPA